ncbi:hypothetical protein [Pseudoxanthomonas wuyuanensis]|uniref:Uncharacterized protein n=1 Tax=Pseudoxanthomonas wuyuanensis TaxID=1073196 RepID=A0A286D4W7_9GAMM|nr:hypothetical protein [Pseudoxanthomonas wuyuanensis]SOD53707.1 hypothetical protein SAMN06296416_102547 [Pseudoxanthomonas wuyuanensis]
MDWDGARRFFTAVMGSSALWGFLGVLTGGALTWWQASRTREAEQHQDRQYAAAALSARLQRFVLACADAAFDDGTVYGRPASEDSYSPQTPTPELTYAGIDIQWRSLPAAVVDDAFRFEIRVSDVATTLHGINEYDTPPYDLYMFERRKLYATLGIEAEELDAQIRAAVKMPGRKSPGSTWSRLKAELHSLELKEQKRNSSLDINLQQEAGSRPSATP